ncbi:ATP-binding protein [Bdellovibrio sp. SKB1291214]|uniref:ATP-binding protein n=1 Tax=Bdellovibrio sp. SKB1291214 TaxID=1732569 RepID=UPI002240017B|nr:ATP-binding protein [Bdellovibrio sp. SKB1291214]UYL08463.1 ATP-binding protein [Bdellovibrio sp. SKB1291214]
MSFNKYSPRLHNVLAFLVLCVAIIVMGGWLTQNPAMIRLAAGYNAMVFNTALLFSFLSLGIVFSDRDHFKIGRVCAILVMSFAAVTFLQYPFGYTSGLDLFFVRYFEEPGTPFPGRMAASTCIAMFLMGLGVFFNKNTLLCQFVRVTCASIVCCVGLVGAVGTIFDINSQYGWGSFARMAPHTSVCFVTLSFALMLQLRQRMTRLGFSRRRFLPFYVLSAGIFVTVGLMQLLLIKDYQKNRTITEIRTTAILENFDAVFTALNRSLERMAKRFILNDYKNKESWQIDAQIYTADFKGIRRILWAEKDLLAKWIYPLNRNPERVIGMKLTQQRGSQGVIEKMLANREPILSDVIPLVTGGDGIVLYYPVFRGDDFLGVLSVVLGADSFFQEAAIAPGYYVRIKDDDDHEFLNTGNAGQVYMRDWGYTATYKALNANWQFTVTPTPEIVQNNSSYLPGVIGVCGVSVSVLLAMSLVFYQRSRESERRMKEAFDWHKAGRDSISLLLLQLDQFGNVSSINKATEDLLGYTEADLIGKRVTLLGEYSEVMMYRGRMEEKLGRTLDNGHDYLEAIFETGDAPGYERTFISKNGRSFNMALSLHRVTNEQGEMSGYLVVAEDVTQRKERERLLKEREEKILVSSRLATLGEMAAGIAHEINNPLAVIGGYLSMLRKNLNNKGLGSDVDLNRRIDSVESMVGRIAKIVRGLRSYAHESVLDDMEEVEIAVIIDDTLAFCHEKFKQHGVHLTASIEPGLTVKCRPYQISQVLLNLLNNAFDAVERSSVKRVRIEAYYNAGGVEICVSDTGPGVPLEMREKIMQPFFTTKEVGKGVGLGLSISMGIIQSHNGKFFLDCDSAQTKFTVWLPHAPHLSS